MKDTRKTKAQLIDELEQLRQQNALLMEALNQQSPPSVEPIEAGDGAGHHETQPINQDTSAPPAQALQPPSNNRGVSLSKSTSTRSVDVTPAHDEIIRAIFQASSNLYFHL